MKILIAEDDPVSRMLLEKTLEKFGYDIISSEDGEIAWNNFKSEPISFLVTDWMMPGMDGKDLCKNIREYEKTENEKSEDKKYCYIIMLTSRSNIDDLVEGMEAGVDDFIAKPFNKKELEVRIKAGIRILDLKNQLTKANKKLREANKMKSEFVGIVSHDLGTPLTVMKGFTKIILDSTLGELNERQKKAITTIYQNIKRLDLLRKEILDITKLDLGEIIIEKSDEYIDDLILHSYSFLKTLAEEKNQEIIINIEENLKAFCDCNKITRVVENYISNAVRYTQRGGRIEIHAKDEVDTIHVFVKDNGRGIPKGEEENIFDKFYTVGEKVKGSTGLGLSIVKGIIEAHKGNVWCESEEGKGSIFHFVIPKYDSEE